MKLRSKLGFFGILLASLAISLIIYGCSLPGEGPTGNLGQIDLSLGYSKVGNQSTDSILGSLSRLLLPTAVTAEITLTDSTGKSFKQSKTLSGQNKTNFNLALPLNSYSLKVEAFATTDTSAPPIFANQTTVVVDQVAVSVPVTLFLLPVSTSSLQSGIATSGNLAAATSASFKYSQTSPSAALTWSGLPSGVSLYFQNSKGLPLALVGSVLPAGSSDGSVYLTLYNASASAVNYNFTLVEGVTGAPGPVTITASDSQTILTWGAITGASSYNLYWSKTTGVTPLNGTLISNVTSPYTHLGLTNGTAVYYVLTAVNGAGESGPSGQVSAIPQVAAPGVPTGFGVTAGNAQTTLTWTAVTGATSYNIYFSNSSGVTIACPSKVTGLTGTSYTHTALVNGSPYFYIITAINAGGESAASSQISATPQVPAPGLPTGLSAATAESTVNLTWTTVAGATSYKIYRSTTSGVTVAAGNFLNSTLSASYSDTGLANNTTYYYVVTALNAGGESSPSLQVSGLPVVPVPTGLTATAGNFQTTLSWATMAGHTFKLYYSTVSPVTKANASIPVAGTTYTQTGLTNGTTYYYAVSSVNASSEESLLSGQVSAVPYSTLTYNGNGNSAGTPPVDATGYLNGGLATVAGNSGTLARTLFTFVGWNTAANGSGTKYLPGASLTFGTNNITLYAIWELTPQTTFPSVAVSKRPEGIAFDGTNLWIGEVNDSKVYQVNPATGTSLSSFAYSNTHAVVFAGTGNFWVTTYWTNPANLYKVSSGGTIVQTINLTASQNFPTALAYDSTNNFLWMINTNSTPPSHLWKYNLTTTALTDSGQFTNGGPGGVAGVSGTAYGLCVDVANPNFLWMVDNGNRLSKIDLTTMTLVLSYTVNGASLLNGIAQIDAKNFWLTDGNNFTYVKVTIP